MDLLHPLEYIDGPPKSLSEPASATADLAVVYIPSSESTLLSFSFLSAENPGLSGDFDAEVDGEDVILLIPRSVDATRLVPAFTVSEGATVQVDGLQQVAGETEQDFTTVLRYTVTAEDQSRSRTYTVYVGRLLEAGEVIGWQRDAGIFRFVSDPRDIKLLEEVRIHLDSTLTRIADTLHATISDTISIDIYPSHAAFLDKLRELGWEPKDWYIGTAIRPDWILVESSNSPDNSLTSGDVTSLITHEGIHAILFTFGTPIPNWLHEGMGGLDAYLLAECFPDCQLNWDFQKSVIESTGKPGLNTMFADPSVGYAFSITTVIFIVKKYGWDALRTFLTAPTDFTVFGLADSIAFEARWHEFLDELWGWVDPGQPPLLPISEARTLPLGLVSVEGTVTWQNQWGDRIRITGLIVEYRLVEIQGAIQDVTELAYGNQKVTLRDSAGTDFPVYVDSRNGMVKGDWPAVGTTVRVVGVLGTDDRSEVPEGTGPRVEVRGKADVTTVPRG